MVVDQQLASDEVDRIFGALADATRRDILTRVLDHEEPVSGLAALYEMSFAAVQKHVAVLERAGLVSKRAHGRERLVRGEVERVRTAARLLEDYEEIWRARIAALDVLLDEPQR